MTDFFVPVPLDFHWALYERRISVSVYALGCYLAGESFRNAKTNAGVASVYPADLAKLFGVSGQTMRTWLRTLEHDGWIEIGEVVERSRAPWAIRLAALASVNTSAKQTPPKNFAQPLQSTSNPTAKQPDIDAHASAGPERASAASPLQSDLPSLTRARDEKKREEKSSSRGRATEQSDGTRKLPYVPNLFSYTGCRAVRGSHGQGHVPDPLGTDKPPAGWPHAPPSHGEVVAALRARGDLEPEQRWPGLSDEERARREAYLATAGPELLRKIAQSRNPATTTPDEAA